MEPSDRQEKESLVDRYVSENHTEAAVKLLYELILDYAGEKNFEKAEALHERMYEVDPLALTEIVRANEIIEAEKSEVLDPQYLRLWSDLHESLSTAEANALFYALKPATFEAGDAVMEQGQLNRRLYFVLSGEINCLYSRDDTEFFVDTLSSGDIIGQPCFFSATVCTVTMKAATRVKAGFLEHETFSQWSREFPALGGKLRDYCYKKDRIRQDLEKHPVERRMGGRLELEGRIGFFLLGKAGKPIGKGYKGEISDISQGGLSFLVKSSRAETLHMLLGRKLLLRFKLPLRGETFGPMEETVTVIAIQAQMFDDYSIHVKFDQEKADRFIADIDPDKPVEP